MFQMCFVFLLVRFGPAFVKYLWNPSVMRLFFFIDFLLTFIDLGNLLELTFSRDFFYYFPCACHVILTILKYRLTVCLLSFFMQFSKKMFIVLVDLFIFNRLIFQKFNIQFLFLLKQFFFNTLLIYGAWRSFTLIWKSFKGKCFSYGSDNILKKVSYF